VVMGQGLEGGCTVYIGSRTSPKYLRIYDKNAESKGKNPATRIEFELKAEVAREVSTMLSVFNGYLSASPIFTGLLGEFHDWENYPDIEAIRYGEVSTIRPVVRDRLLSRKEWLLKQVLPTFIKDPHGEGGELWEWFKAKVAASDL